MRRFLIVLAIGAILLGVSQPVRANTAREEMNVAHEVHMRLLALQPIPTDMTASYERHNIIKRTYWINGLRTRAQSLVFPCPDIPIAYIILFAPNGEVVGRFPVLGKVTSLNYSLVPYSEYFFSNMGGPRYSNTDEGERQERQHRVRWTPNPGGVFGSNTQGIFWFMPCGSYMEFNGAFTFSDIPFYTGQPLISINDRS